MSLIIRVGSIVFTLHAKIRQCLDKSSSLYRLKHSLDIDTALSFGGSHKVGVVRIALLMDVVLE